MEQNFKPYKTNEYLDSYVDSENFYDRIYAVNQHYAVDILKNDSNHYVREAVAVNGFYIDELKNDADPIVKAAAMRHIIYDLQKEKASIDKQIDELKKELAPIQAEANNITDNSRDYYGLNGDHYAYFERDTVFYDDFTFCGKTSKEPDENIPNATYQAEYKYEIGHYDDDMGYTKPIYVLIDAKSFITENKTMAYLTKISASDIVDIPADVSIKLQELAQEQVKKDELEYIIEPVVDKMREHYTNLYDKGDNYHDTYDYNKALEFGEQFISSNPHIMKAITDLRGDVISSDREVVAFAYALQDARKEYEGDIYKDVYNPISKSALKEYSMSCIVKCKLPPNISNKRADINIGDATHFGDVGDFKCDTFNGSVRYDVTVKAINKEDAIEKANTTFENADFGDLKDLDISNGWKIYNVKYIKEKDQNQDVKSIKNDNKPNKTDNVKKKSLERE